MFPIQIPRLLLLTNVEEIMDVTGKAGPHQACSCSVRVPEAYRSLKQRPLFPSMLCRILLQDHPSSMKWPEQCPFGNLADRLGHYHCLARCA